MAIASSADRPGSQLLRSLDLTTSPERAFDLLCEVEKWPLWLSFLKSARRLDERVPLGEGSEIAIRSAIPGEAEERYEVDRFIDGFIVSLVGMYSLRRRIDFRIERKGPRARLVVRLEYPAYGGALGALIDRVTARRRLDALLEHSLTHFKGLIEFREQTPGDVLVDF